MNIIKSVTLRTESGGVALDILSIVFIAIGLAMDAFAVSIASGIAIKQQRHLHALRLGVFFGLFQAAMPVAGWFAGTLFAEMISGIDHWLAFGLLALIGGKMIYESVWMGTEEAKMLGTTALLALSIATSIDALAVGLSLSFINVPIILPSVIIGIITFLFSYAGVFIGNRVGHLFESGIEAFGGIVLVGIGIKILVEHIR